MAYDGKLMRRALQRFQEDRQDRQNRFRERRESIFIRQPRLRQIDEALRSTAARLAALVLGRQADTGSSVSALREENLALQSERRKLLAQMGLPEDCLRETPICPLCGDSGYRNGHVCRCLLRYYAQEQQKELSRLLDLGNQSFETFSLEWYSREHDPALGLSPRENMEWVYQTCRRYAERFGPGSGSLLLTGQPGLGKTFLSAAIAREISGEGHSVVYDSSVNIFSRFEAQKFGREDATADIERVLRCDLLILDDLGTELTTPFVQSALYQIVNGRLLERLPSIVSTNLRVEELSQRYSPQIASRIQGEYQILPFFGQDIRRLKQEQG